MLLPFLFFFNPIAGAAAAGQQTAGRPEAAAVPASLHKDLHQTAGTEHKDQADQTQGQAGGPESSAQTSRQTQVHI